MSESEEAEQGARVQDSLDTVRKELEENILWQLAGPGMFWFCPFCATARPGILYVPGEAPSAEMVMRVRRHLRRECPRYTEATASTTVDESLRLRAKLEEADAVQEDLRLAHERQRHLLPAEPPSMPNSDLSILYRPAGLMGGDFYDFIKLPKDRLGIIVGDVSGHGMEAGILMGMAKKVLNMRLRQYHDPLVTVIRANEDLHAELDRQSFVTAVVAVFDARQYELKYARAGHVPPYHLRKDEVRRLGAPGPALGLILAGGFERGIQHERVAIQPGDLFLFHTDGVEDVKNRQDEDFGSEQLETVLRSTAGSEAGEILSVLKFAMREFAEGTPHEDDITAVCLKVK